MSTTSSTPSNLSGKSGDLNVREVLKAIEDVALAPSKEAGKIGRKISLRTNYYRASVAPNRRIFHYDVTIKETNATLGKESVKFKEEKIKFFQAFLYGQKELAQVRDYIAYDGQANAYYSTDLSFGGGKITKDERKFKFDYAPRGTRKREFVVLLRKVNEFNSNDINSYLSGHSGSYKSEQIQAFDVILRHHASQHMIMNGRNFFDPDSAGKKDLGSGREILSGYYQSCRMIQGRSGGSLALNIDVANTAFMKQILATQFAEETLRPRGGMQDIQGRNFWTDSMRKRFEGQCKGLQFIGTHLKGKDGQAVKTWRCNSLSKNGAAFQQFSITDKNGRKVTTTVRDYYKKEYGITLQFPDMPCIVNGSKANPDRIKYFPAELMKIAPRQAHKGKLDEQMTSNMIRAVATPAPVRQRDTDTVAKKAIGNAAKMAEHHGIKINAQMEKIEGRVLPAPKLDYTSRGKASTAEPRQGSWDTRDLQFLKGATVNNWVILNTARCDDRQLQQFADGLCKSAHFNGVKMSKPQKIFHTRGNADLETKLRLCKQNKIELAVIVMPRRSTADYSFIKTTAECGFGVMTQCIQAKNVERGNAQLYGNLLQKINTKLGGTNTKINASSKPAIFAKPIMVVGLSIAHSPPGSGTGR